MDDITRDGLGDGLQEIECVTGDNTNKSSWPRYYDLGAVRKGKERRRRGTERKGGWRVGR